MIGPAAIHVHTDTNGIALILAIDVESCEPGVSLNEAQEGQRPECALRKIDVHFRLMVRLIKAGRW